MGTAWPSHWSVSGSIGGGSRRSTGHRRLHEPGEALEIVRRRLVPGASLYLFGQGPGWKASEQAVAFSAELGGVLEGAGFEIQEASVKALGAGFAAAVVARVS